MPHCDMLLTSSPRPFFTTAPFAGRAGPIWFEIGGATRFWQTAYASCISYSVVLGPVDRPWTRVFFDNRLCIFTAWLKS